MSSIPTSQNNERLSIAEWGAGLQAVRQANRESQALLRAEVRRQYPDEYQMPSEDDTVIAGDVTTTVNHVYPSGTKPGTDGNPVLPPAPKPPAKRPVPPWLLVVGGLTALAASAALGGLAAHQFSSPATSTPSTPAVAPKPTTNPTSSPSPAFQAKGKKYDVGFFD